MGRWGTKDDVSFWRESFRRESFCQVGSPVFIVGIQSVFAEAPERLWPKVELMAAGNFQWLRRAWPLPLPDCSRLPTLVGPAP